MRHCTLYLFLILFLTVVSCSDLDPIYERLDAIDSEISEMQQEINKLKNAWEEAKIISNIQPIDPESTDFAKIGWNITFNDGTTIQIFNELDSFIPTIKFDSEGYWMVSYDGINYEYITNSNGDKLNAIGIDGHDGEDGRDGQSVRVTLDPEGYYIFEIYDLSHPEIVLESLYTPFQNDPGLAISSIVKDDLANIITFTMGDGTVYDFVLQKSSPTSIVILTIENLKFYQPGQELSFDIRINPSDIFFNYNVENEECDLEIDFITKEEYDVKANAPVSLINLTPTKDPENNIIEGQYTVTIRNSEDNIFNYKEGIFFKLRYTNSYGEIAYITSPIIIIENIGDYNIYPNDNFPILMIETPSAITSKNYWTEDCEIKIISSLTDIETLSNVSIKGRGNTTWIVDKKPYAIKLDKKTELFGFPKHKRWVLLANYYDSSNIRNEVAFFMSRLSSINPEIGMEYSPRSKFVRIIMNNQYQGLYLLTEQLKIDENRVNVGDDGFLMEIDARAGQDPEDIYFKLDHINNPIVIKDPDLIEGDESYTFLVSRMNEIDEALFSSDFMDNERGYRNYIDTKSFIDWILVNEITKNSDSAFFSSCYMNLSRDGKLKMGPIWDFDTSIGNYSDSFSNESHVAMINNPEGFLLTGVQWFKRMLQDPQFVKEYKERFNYYYDKRYEIYSYIESLNTALYPAIMENDMIWHFYSDPYDETITYKAFYKECNNIKEWLDKRYNWLYNEIKDL